jgi:predicted ATPase with chaperone activity
MTRQTGQISGAVGGFSPPQINSVEDTGLSPLWLQDLILKVLYFRGYLTGFKIAEEIALPLAGVTDQLLAILKQEKFIEVKSSQGGLGEGAYTYGITSQGILRAREAMERSQYAGPAPVPFEVYNEAIRRQKSGRLTVTTRTMRQILSQLVISESTFQRLGPALNSGSSIFMYGPPGNGKTSIARAFGNLVLSQNMYIPYALYLDGQVIKVYDAVSHSLAPDTETGNGNATGGLRTNTRRDPRWVKIRRPFIVVGGELTLEGLDLVFDDTTKFYEAPFK